MFLSFSYSNMDTLRSFKWHYKGAHSVTVHSGKPSWREIIRSSGFQLVIPTENRCPTLAITVATSSLPCSSIHWAIRMWAHYDTMIVFRLFNISWGRQRHLPSTARPHGTNSPVLMFITIVEHVTSGECYLFSSHCSFVICRGFKPLVHVFHLEY